MSLLNLKITRKILPTILVFIAFVVVGLMVASVITNWVVSIGVVTINDSIDSAQSWFDAQSISLSWLRFGVYALAIWQLPRAWSEKAGRPITMMPVICLCLVYEMAIVHRLGF